MLSILRIILQFILAASDPHETCELMHRDSSVAGTCYLCCARTTADGTEVISVGHFIPASKNPLDAGNAQ